MRRKAWSAVFAALALLATALAAQPAIAHTLGLSSGEYEVRGATLRGVVVLARDEARALVPELDGDHDGRVTMSEVDAAKPALFRALLEPIVAEQEGMVVPLRLRDAALTDEDGLRVVFEAAGRADADWSLDLAFLRRLSPAHRHVARVLGPEVSDRVVDGEHSSLRVPASPDASSNIERTSADPSFVAMGVKHILSGPDHLAFLLGVVFLPARRRDHLVAITAFTVAHSFALALAVLGFVAPSPRVVEPLIALSVAWVGGEVFLQRGAASRARLTLPFGLVHGFGFAGALTELGLARESVVAALVRFNVGVEIGQVAVAALFLVALLHLRRREAFVRFGHRVAGGALVASGIAWALLRVLSE